MKVIFFFISSLVWATAFSQTGLPIVVDHALEMPAAISQGEQGSCTAFAVAYLKAWQEAKETGKMVMMSPSYVYNSVHHPDWEAGIYPSQALNFVCSNGIVPLQVMPYNEHDESIKPTEIMTVAARQYRGAYWYHISSAIIETAKEVLIGSPIISSFYGHTACLVGYNDTIMVDGKRGAFKFINSYGTTWTPGLGSHYRDAGSGFGYVQYDACWAGYYVLVDAKNIKSSRTILLATNFADANANALENYPNELVLMMGNDTIDAMRPASNTLALFVPDGTDLASLRLQYKYYNSQNSPDNNPERSLAILSAYCFEARGKDFLMVQAASQDSLFKRAYSAYFWHKIEARFAGAPTDVRVRKKEDEAIYPNPCSDYINYILPSSAESERAEIFDLSGQKIKSVSVHSGQNRIDVSGFTPGVYFLSGHKIVKK